jgi:pyruvate/2-oxoglutarate/acetoin dehydrogenase E1 component
MREITYSQAVREALKEEMLRDPSVFMYAEDVGPHGGTYGVSGDLYEQFGEERVRDTPISESAIVGCGVGAAMTGMRPVPEIMQADFLGVCLDQIANQAGQIRYMFGGKVKMPLVIRTAEGAGRSAAAHHSQCLEAWILHSPGLLLAMPSTPYDAKGLLKTAIRGEDPVVFIEHKMLYRTLGPVPDEGEDYTIPFGVAATPREGTDATVVAVSAMVPSALAAADKLADEGVSVEVIDPRTIRPLDLTCICDSVRKTHRLAIVHEARKTGGIGAEIACRVMENAFDYLDAPIARVGAWDTPIPFSPVLEKGYMPDENDIIEAVRGLL